MATEIIIPHERIKNSQTCYRETENAFKAKGLNAHINEVRTLEDDNKKGIRRLEVVSTKYFTVPAMPWHKDK
jgi:hypothetical protein